MDIYYAPTFECQCIPIHILSLISRIKPSDYTIHIRKSLQVHCVLIRSNMISVCSRCSGRNAPFS